MAALWVAGSLCPLTARIRPPVISLWNSGAVSRTLDSVKRATTLRLTTLACLALAAQAQQRLDPCNAPTFNEHACMVAIENRGYCWNGRWVNLKYRNPFPYYYDAYQELLAGGATVVPAAVGSCTPPTRTFVGIHGATHGGFGSTGTSHACAAHG